jgi:hypothetical protein
MRRLILLLAVAAGSGVIVALNQPTGDCVM